jgi:tetratricopeptide (TPR) repeat protein
MSSVEVLKGSMNKVNRETVGDLADSMTNLADILLRRGENSEAEQVFKKVLELREKILGPKDQAVAQALINLGISIEIQGRVSEAVEGYSRALAIYREKFPGDHPKVAWALHSLVNGLMADGRPEEAWSLAEEAAAMLRRLSPGKPDHLARMLSVLAYIRFTDGRLGEAEKLFSELVEVLRDSATEDSIELAEGIYNLASVRRLLELNARSLAEEALAIYDRLKRNNPSERSNFQKLVEEYRHSDVNAMIRNGDQEGAAKELDGLIEINPGDHWKWYQIMALNAHLGRTNYLQHCSEVFHRFASTAAPEIAERIAKASMLLPPPPGSEWANKAVELSARAVGLGTNSGFLPYYQTAHALALLRTGQWDACTTEARKALREPGVVPARDAQAGAVLGIAYRKLGKAEEARSAVKQAMTSMPEGFLESGALPSGAGDDWHDWLMARVLVREALAELSMDPP